MYFLTNHILRLLDKIHAGAGPGGEGQGPGSIGGVSGGGIGGIGDGQGGGAGGPGESSGGGLGSFGMEAAMAQSDAQAAENAAQASIGFGDLGQMGSFSEAIAMAQSDAQAAENNSAANTSSISDRANAKIKALRVSFLKKTFASLIVGMNPISMAISIAKANMDLNSVESELASEFGKEAAASAMASAMATGTSPGDTGPGGPDQWLSGAGFSYSGQQNGGGTVGLYSGRENEGGPRSSSGRETGGGTVASPSGRQAGAVASATGSGEAAATAKFWDEFKGEWFSNKDNAKSLYQESADYLSGQTDIRDKAIQAATGEQTANIDSLLKQYAKPVSFDIMGDTVSFVPRGARNTISGLTDVGQTKMGNIQDTANAVLQSAPLRAPGVGKMSYLDALANILGKETASESSLAAASAAQRRLDQAEPGFVDYAGEAVNIGSGVAKIWDTAKDWDWFN